ncbi:hypothetical protein evm_008327 [Chilo suppressalis]|nr:hypothetical protein evm_008327 [Chilo suppressalis]
MMLQNHSTVKRKNFGQIPGARYQLARNRRRKGEKQLTASSTWQAIHSLLDFRYLCAGDTNYFEDLVPVCLWDTSCSDNEAIHY